MINQQILEKAIQKAIDGGWLNLSGEVNVTFGHVKNKGTDNVSVQNNEFGSYEALIFNHDFAKALFGETPMHEFAWGETTKSFDGEVTEYDFQANDSFAMSNWQYHLQQLVIADDVFKYLEENI